MISFKEFSYFLSIFEYEIEIENILRAFRSLENVIIPVKIKQSVGFGPRQNLQSFEQAYILKLFNWIIVRNFPKNS